MSHGASMDYEDPSHILPLVFSGFAHGGGCIFVPTSSACGAHRGTFISNPPQRGCTDWIDTRWGHWASGGFVEIAISFYTRSWLRDRWWYVIRLRFPSSWANYIVHLIEYVHLNMLLRLIKQVRWDLWGHMGGNKKVIKQLKRACFISTVGIVYLSVHLYNILILWTPVVASSIIVT